MKKLNNKGYMLIEIILASVIAMSIAYYLLNLTYKFKNKNEDIYYSTELVSLKNNITKNIMGDLNNKNNKRITDVNTDNDNYVTFRVEGKLYKLLLTKVNGKTTKLEYGPLNSDDVNSSFNKSDPSYYQKDFSNTPYLEIGKISLTSTSDNSKEKTIYKITIPISNIYEKNNYNVILMFEEEEYIWSERPLIIHYCLNGGHLSAGSNPKATDDQIIKYKDSANTYYLTPNTYSGNPIYNVGIEKDGKKFTGWYVMAKSLTDKNDVYWIGCTDDNDPDGRCRHTTPTHGWYKRNNSSISGFFIGNPKNHKIGYGFVDNAVFAELIELHELWLYACWTDNNQTVECNKKNNLPEDDAECSST